MATRALATEYSALMSYFGTAFLRHAYNFSAGVLSEVSNSMGGVKSKLGPFAGEALPIKVTVCQPLSCAETCGMQPSDWTDRLSVGCCETCGEGGGQLQE